MSISGVSFEVSFENSEYNINELYGTELWSDEVGEDEKCEDEKDEKYDGDDS